MYKAQQDQCLNKIQTNCLFTEKPKLVQMMLV